MNAEQINSKEQEGYQRDILIKQTFFNAVDKGKVFLSIHKPLQSFCIYRLSMGMQEV